MTNTEHEYSLPPFPGFPSVSRYIGVGPVADALTRISRSIEAREAISVAIGPPGTGKSLLCALLAERFADSHEVVVLGETAINDAGALERLLLHRLGVAGRPDSSQHFELMLDEHLNRGGAKRAGIVMIIDEAASLGEDVLEAVRRVTNIIRDGHPVISAVLAGGVKLDETLASPSMESLVQRIAARCYLHPLNADEARHYIHGAIRACGSPPSETITDAALSAIHHATSGVPRLINQMMTEAIDCAAEMEQFMIQEHTVDRAWARLQQLPGPMMEQPSLSAETSVVEFGELDPQIESTQSVSECDATHSAAQSDELVDASANSSLDQPLSHSNQGEADSLSLFGDFENEEDVAVGGTARERVKEHVEIDDLQQTIDLESMLHCEIVGFGEFDPNMTLLSETECGAESIDAAREESSSQPSIKSHIEETFEASPVSANSDVESPSVVWYDEPEPAAAGRDTPDDRDLLFITEDVDLDDSDNQEASSLRIDSDATLAPPKLDVDYREILQRMRQRS